MMYHQKQQAFSLIETLVAISILLIVIVGPMTITARTAKSSTFATEQTQAFFLAQEGIELAQKLRDDLFLAYFASNSGTPWGNFTNPNGTYQHCYNGNGCGLYWTSNTQVSVTANNCGGTTDNTCRIYQKNTGRSYYTHVSTNNTLTPFTRRLKFTRDNAAPERVVIKSEVTWRTGSIIALQRVELETYLYNVYGRP